MTSPKQTTKQHSTLVGARFAALTVTDRMIVSCPDIERLTVLNLSAAADVAGTVLLDDMPGAVLYSSSKVWTVTKDGYLLKLSNADTPVLQATINIRASRSDWITSCNTIIIAPGPVGSLVSLNSSGEILDQIDGVLSRVTMALGLSDGYLYAFDSDGNGAVVLVDTTTGLMTKIADFEATDCQGILQGFVDSEFVVLAIGELDRVVVFDVSADRLDPVISESTIYDGYTLNGVLNDYDLNPDFSPLTEEFRSGLGITEWWPVVLGKFLGYQDVIFLHPDSGRVTMLLNEAPVVSAGIDQEVDFGDTVQLAGVVSDDGFPDFDSLSHQWTKVSGPGTVSFDADNTLNAIATIGTAGVYVLRLTATDGQHSVSDTMTVTVDAPELASSFSSIAFNGDVNAMELLGTILYMVGNFTTVTDASGAHTRNFAAALDVATGLFTAWNPNLGGGSASSLAVDGANVFVGGNFTTVNGVTRDGSAKVDATSGALVSAFDTGVSGLAVLAMDTDSTYLYIGGTFIAVGGVTRNYLARVNKTTGALDSWNPNPNNNVYAIKVVGSTVFVAGAFGTVAGGATVRTRNAAWDTGTGVITAWNPCDIAVFDNNYALCVSEAGSSMYIGDRITTADFTHYVREVNLTDGTATSWNPGAHSQATGIAVLSGNVYFVNPTNVAGSSRGYGASVNATTGALNAFNPGLGGTAPKCVVAADLGGGAIFIGGDIFKVSPSRSYFIALAPDGTVL